MIKVDFWTSMTAAQTIEPEQRATPAWNLLEAAYQRWNPQNVAQRPIPKVIHQIWLGSPLPKLYARWGKTWQVLHPGWEYRLWTEKDIDAFGLTNRDSYEKSPNYGVKSDLVRYEILERLGGVYADTDFESLASFDDLARSTSFFAGLMYARHPAINNGLIGASPGHPVLRDMIRQLTVPFTGHDGMQILAYSGPSRFSDVILDQFGRGVDGVVLPTTYLYPFPNRDIALVDVPAARRWAGPESLAIHYWEVSWRQQSLASRAYWWMKKRLPRWLFVAIYRVVKGKNPE